MQDGLFAEGNEEDDLMGRLPYNTNHEPKPTARPRPNLIFDYDQIDTILERSDNIEHAMYLGSKLAKTLGVGLGAYSTAAIAFELFSQPYVTPVHEMTLLGLSFVTVGLGHIIATYEPRVVERIRCRAAFEQLHARTDNDLQLPRW